MNVRSFKQFREMGEPDILYAERIYINDEWDLVKGKFSNKNKIVEDLTGTQLRNKMRELDKLLKAHDYYYVYSDDSRAYRKGKESQDRIEALVKDIGPSGLKLYRKYLKKNESVEKPRNTGTAKYMDTRKWFAEMNGVEATGSLNNCDTDKNTLGTSKSYFSDGQLYSGFSFYPPTPKSRSIEQKSLERNEKYGMVYKG
jgi:hypothetical protein